MNKCGYSVLCDIDKGSFGAVQKIRRDKDNRIYAWKTINYKHATKEGKQRIVNEVNIIRELRNKHIIKYYDRLIDTRTCTLYIVTEWYSGSNLHTTLLKWRVVPELFIWNVFYSIANALYTLHNHTPLPIIHRDISPRNIMVSGQHIILIDFGLSIYQEDCTPRGGGTAWYMAPERLNRTNTCTKSDVWSLGCVLYEMVTRCVPFPSSSMDKMIVSMNTDDPFVDGASSRFALYSPQLEMLVRTLLIKEYTRRPDINQIITDYKIAIS